MKRKETQTGREQKAKHKPRSIHIKGEEKKRSKKRSNGKRKIQTKTHFNLFFEPAIGGEWCAPFLEALQYQVDAWSGRSKPLFHLPAPKIHLICSPQIEDVSDIKLIRTDTTLDLSQKAEKRYLHFQKNTRFPGPASSQGPKSEARGRTAQRPLANRPLSDPTLPAPERAYFLSGGKAKA